MEKFKNHTNLIGKTLLIVEDNDELRSLMTTLFSYGGARCIEATNGKECLDIIAKEKIDAIFMDINMPVMDGNTASRAIKNCEESSSIPIIIVSSNRYSVGKPIKAEGYIYKPFTPTEILERAVKVLSKYQ